MLSTRLVIEIVSILTGSEEPVQHGDGKSILERMKFQSSPAPKSRCNVSAHTLSQLRLCFNPHRLRRAGATRRLSIIRRLKLFQSSPAPKSRCNAEIINNSTTKVVSILTGSEEPVQRLCSLRFISHRSFNPHRLRRAGATLTTE